MFGFFLRPHRTEASNAAGQPLSDPILNLASAGDELSEMNRTRMKRWNDDALTSKHHSAQSWLASTPKSGSMLNEDSRLMQLANDINHIGENYLVPGMAAALTGVTAAVAMPIALPALMAGGEILGAASGAAFGIPVAESMLATEVGVAAGGAAWLKGAPQAQKLYNNAARFFTRDGAERLATRRAYLDAKFGRTGDLNLDINYRGYMDKVRNLDVATLENQPVFYSGDFGANRARAEIFARETGRLTLEMTSGGKYLDNQLLFKLFEGKPELAVKVWSTLSERFAQQASGEIHAFAYNSSPRSIFNQVELKALERNSNVSPNIIYKRDPWLEHDPYVEHRSSLGFR